MSLLATHGGSAVGMLGGRRLGIAMLAGGALLLAVAGGFFGYQAYIDERYETVVVTTPPTLPPEDVLEQLTLPPAGATAPVDDTTPATVEPAVALPAEDTGPAASAATLGEVYGDWDAAPQDWANPFWAEERGAPAYTSEFLPVGELDLPESGLGPATRVRIPIIGLEARTIELGVITTDEGHLKYESPIYDVGIIPGHTTPGERGNTWLFGHLESPLKDEGAVFRNLPKLHDFLRTGEAVYVIVDSDDGSFLYQATEFRIMRAEDVTFWGSDGRTATLVCSWPRFVYDERVVVTTELVGARLNRPLS